MIDYHTFCELHRLCEADGLSLAQIARILNLDERTAAKWTSTETYQPRATVVRPSKLDPYRADIVRWLHQHPYSAQQIFQRLRQAGYTGGYTILKKLVRLLRPPVTVPRQTLIFLPGQCAQVDWGSAGWLQVGSTRRRLSFFVMILAHSRMQRQCSPG
jgi:transposase